MRGFARRHIELIALVVLLLLQAFIASSTVISVIEVSLASLPDAPAEPDPLQAGNEQTQPVPDSARRPPETTRPRRTNQPSPPPRAAFPSRSTIPFAVVGTLVARRPEWSMASVEDARTRRTRTVMIGDVIDDAQVVSIGRSSVVLARGDALEFIDVTRPSGALTAVSVDSRAMASSRPSGTTSAPASGGTAVLAPTLKQTAPGEYSVTRADVDRVTQSIMQLGMDARIVPSFTGGNASGFKLMHIRPGSLYSSLGMQNGDVLKRVNGLSLDDPGKILEVYQRLRESPRLDVEIERNGARVTQTVRIEQ